MDTKSILVEYRFLNCSSDFCRLFLRQYDNLSEIFKSEFQILNIWKKCVFENLENTFWDSLKKNTYLQPTFQLWRSIFVFAMQKFESLKKMQFLESCAHV